MSSEVTVAEVRSFVYARFAVEVELPEPDVRAGVLTLTEVAQRSPKITNSVDLMECFARTSNAVRKEYGIRVRLPAYPANTALQVLMESFVGQVEAQLVKEAVA